jgi:cellulose synthase/poly-beta-1,6-N-acetylglucosamine synthase-like glycosyltransferase
MTTLCELLLALSLLWLAYTYLGYPALLFLFARRSAGVRPGAAAYEPLVTVITVAHNEERVIAESISNKLDSDYPPDRLDMIVISDESVDATDHIVRELVVASAGRLRFIRQEPRQGKTAGLNLAVEQARGEILVFADANSLYEKPAIGHIVSNFADQAIGYVTGKMIYTNPDGSVTGEGCTAYMRYENLLRAWETRFGSVVGVDGGIDAVRKSLYQPMRADQLPDFVLPLRVVEQGYRVVYEPRAVLREPALGSPSQEYRMRVRVALRAIWALYDLRHLLSPWRDARFSWQLLSHKVLRYSAFVPQMVALVTNALLLSAGPGFRLLFLGQVTFYLLAALGYVMSKLNASFPLATGPYYLLLLNLSCAHATVRFLRGQKQVLWQPRVG